MEGHGDDTFHNIQPRTREERAAEANKDMLEKKRLQVRRGGGGTHYRYDGVDNPVIPAKDSLSYASESERFMTDFAAEEYERRMEKLSLKEAQMEKKREDYYAREDARWNVIEKEYEYHEHVLEENKFSDKAKRNTSKEDFNIITLKYCEGFKGEMKKFDDDNVRYRAARRADQLSKQMHSQSYNIITGEDTDRRVKVPEKPEKPVTPAEREGFGAVRMDLAYGGVAGDLGEGSAYGGGGADEDRGSMHSGHE